MRPPLAEALDLEPPQSLAHRRAADIQLRRHIPLAQAGARDEMSGANGFADLGINPIWQ